MKRFLVPFIMAVTLALFSCVNPISEPSNWQIQTKTDSLTGEQIVIYSTTAIEVENVQLYPLYKPVLVIRNNKTKNIIEAFVVFYDYLSIFNMIKVEYKFDQGDITTEYWYPSTDGDAVFSPNPQNFIQRIRNSKELVFRAYDYAGDKKTLKFKVEGLPQF